MYIKYVRINGFKSYRDKVQCGPLSPMHNSVVGLNGSGKSNFFAALRFVLSDAYSNMRPEERGKLVNEGAGNSLVSAYVEIVFDNSDHRLDSDKEEVTIRRQFGLKKDEYFVDSKHVNKQEVANMLETAGFSKSNPYYIVEQGKVTKITEMSDKARLELLKEVAGTNVYEEKKEESLKIMKESDAKMAEIKKNLDMIEERLAKLDAEKEELSQYYLLDKERRSLQHALLAQKIKGLHEELTGIERERTELKVDSAENDTERSTLEKDLQTLEQKVDVLDKLTKRLEAEKKTLDKEEEDRLKEFYAEEAKVKQYQRAVQNEEQEFKVKSSQADKLKKDIKAAESKLVEATPLVEAHQKEYDGINEEWRQVDRDLESLSAIRGHGEQYKDKAQRDAALNSRIKEYQTQIDQRRKDEANLLKGIEACNKALVDAEGSITNVKEAAAARKDEIRKKKESLSELEKKKHDITCQIKEIDRLMSDIKDLKDAASKSIQNSKDRLLANMPPASSRALRFLSNYVAKHNIQGYYGPLIDLIDCNERYYTAVEQAGGARMFNAVVEDANVASKLVNALMEHREGRLQFLPLNNLRPETPAFPKDANNAQPMSKCIKYDSKFEPAIMEVFGKTLLCDNLETATGYRRSHNIGCVTMDGDKIAKKGSIKGGYYDVSQSKIKLNKAVRSEEENIRTKQAEMDKLAAQKTQLEQSSTVIVGDKSKLEAEMKGLTHASSHDSNAQQRERQRIEELREELKSKGSQLEKIRHDIEDLEHNVHGLEDQLNAPFSQTLTPAQEQKMNKLAAQRPQLKKKLEAEQKALTEAQKNKQSLEDTIQAKSLELDALQAELEGMHGVAGEELESANEKFSNAKSESAASASRRLAKEEEMAKAKSDFDQCKENLRKTKEKLKKQSRDVEEARKKLDNLQDKKNRLIGEMDHAQAQQRDLGSLPEAFEKYKNKGQKALHDELHKVTEKLKQFKDVNKKALDQFNQFTEQREKFKQRKEELEKGAESIRDLINKLDEKKDDAIQTTFRMVARNFGEVFKQIVPGGSGELIMKTSDKDRGDDDEDDDEREGAARQTSAIRKYVGVAVKVRFQSGGEVRVMRTLSGGQKSVVALAIIFAIQQCDPAPFYLFDEVDANLDPMYRNAVAAMISKQKMGDGESSVQFITSSFQPELVQVADCHWLTSHHGMSRISLGTLDDSLTVLREAQKSANVAPKK